MYAARALASAAVPCSYVLPDASSRLSTSVSTRETKKLATECTSSIVRPS